MISFSNFGSNTHANGAQGPARRRARQAQRARTSRSTARCRPTPRSCPRSSRRELPVGARAAAERPHLPGAAVRQRRLQAGLAARRRRGDRADPPRHEQARSTSSSAASTSPTSSTWRRSPSWTRRRSKTRPREPVEPRSRAARSGSRRRSGGRRRRRGPERPREQRPPCGAATLARRGSTPTGPLGRSFRTFRSSGRRRGHRSASTCRAIRRSRRRPCRRRERCR